MLRRISCCDAAPVLTLRRDFFYDSRRGEADLVFINERPFAVLEWAQTGAAMVTVELDPAKLRADDPAGRNYKYLESLRDPRQASSQ